MWGQVSGEWDEQHKISWCVEDPSKLQRPETDKRERRGGRGREIAATVIWSYLA